MKKEKIQKILLINPPTGLFIREDRCQVPVHGLSSTSIRPPMDLAYMAGNLQEKVKNVKLRIIDFPAENKNWHDFEYALKMLMPDFLVISVTTPTVNMDMMACFLAKKIVPGITTIAKGAHFLTEDMNIMKLYEELDIVIRGEYEFTICDIVKNKPLKNIDGITYRIKNKIFKNKQREYIKDLDSISFPARHLLNNNLYTRPDSGEMQTTIQTNRGCPSQCIFCLATGMYGNAHRKRSPKNIVDEIEACVKKYKIKNFFFRADTFTIDKNWTIKVCKEIIKRKLNIQWVCNSRVDTIDEERLKWMKKSGCWLIAFGVESGSPDILKKIKKGIKKEWVERAAKLCKKYKMYTFMFFMLGFPWETRLHVEQTINFAEKLDADFYEFHIAVPFPGTPLYKIVEDYNLFRDTLNQTHHAGASIKTLNISGEELLQLRDKALKTILLRPRYILKTLKKINNFKKLFHYFKFGILKLYDMYSKKIF